MKKNLALHSAFSIVVGGLSLLLTYNWPGRTDCWAWYFGYVHFPTATPPWSYIGGWLEFSRLILCLALLIAVQFLFREQAKPYWSEPLHVFSFYKNALRLASRKRRYFLLFAVLIICVFNLGVGPQHIQETFSRYLMVTPPYSDCLRPYLFYLPYSLVLYNLILVPALLPVYDALRADLRSIRPAGRPIENILESEVTTEQQLVRSSEELLNSLGTVRRLYIRIADKYIWLAFIVIVYFLAERFSFMILTLSCIAQECMKIGIWILIGVVPYFAVSGVRRYNFYYRKGLEALDRLGGSARDHSLSKKEFLENCESFEAKGPITFLYAFLKQGTIAGFLLFVVLVSAYAFAKSQGIKFQIVQISVNSALPSVVTSPLMQGIDKFFPSGTAGESSKKLSRSEKSSLPWYIRDCQQNHEKGDRKGLSSTVVATPMMGGIDMLFPPKPTGTEEVSSKKLPLAWYERGCQHNHIEDDRKGLASTKEMLRKCQGERSDLRSSRDL